MDRQTILTLLSAPKFPRVAHDLFNEGVRQRQGYRCLDGATGLPREFQAGVATAAEACALHDPLDRASYMGELCFHYEVDPTVFRDELDRLGDDPVRFHEAFADGYEDAVIERAIFGGRTSMGLGAAHP